MIPKQRQQGDQAHKKFLVRTTKLCFRLIVTPARASSFHSGPDVDTLSHSSRLDSVECISKAVHSQASQGQKASRSSVEARAFLLPIPPPQFRLARLNISTYHLDLVISPDGEDLIYN